jgi:hypothetical protein
LSHHSSYVVDVYSSSSDHIYISIDKGLTG